MAHDLLKAWIIQFKGGIMVKNLFVTLVALATIGSASATPYSQVTAAARIQDAAADTGWNPVTHYDSTPGTSTQAALLPSGQAFGWASAGPGYAKALAQASTYGGAYSIGFGAGAYNDMFTLSAAGMNGQAGRFTAVFLLDYSLTAFAPEAIAYMHFSAGIGRSGASLVLGAQTDGNLHYLQGVYDLNDALGYRQLRDTPVTAISITSDFVWGEAINLNYRMLVQAQAYGPLATGAIVDASHSAYWGGISAISSGGQLITDYSITSESGADYSKSFAPAQEPTPVPEPTTISLMLIGACLIARVAVARSKLR